MKTLRSYFLMFFFSIFLAACGGGEEEQTELESSGAPVVAQPPVVAPPPAVTPVPSVPVVNPPTIVPPPTVVNPPVVVLPVTPIQNTTTTCLPGVGTDYQVGVGKPYTSPEQVPWENIKAGDTVRIFYQATPYKAKFMLAGQGTANAPIRICGVKGPNGERPIIEGKDALSRPQLSAHYSSTPDYRAIHEDRSLILIKASSLVNYMDTPSYIQIDGLNIRSMYPGYTYSDSSGAIRSNVQFAACVWVDRGHNVTITDNEISDCPMGIFSKSTDEGAFAVTKNLVITNNHFHNLGVVGSDREHSTYTQSHGILIEGNRYSPPRAGAGGNSIKDRSAGLVVRYNRVEEGARNIDMVEAEDFPLYAMAQPEYRATYVYGNQFIKTGESGSFFHYGGDHFGAPVGANWGESYFRRGTLYFFNNTVIGKGVETRLFQLSTSLERLEAWNNVFWFEPTVTTARLVQPENDTLSTLYTGDGVLNFGKNWFKSGWVIMDPYHTTKAQITGTENFITGETIPFDPITFKPLPGAVIVDAAQANLPAVNSLPVSKQWSTVGLESRSVKDFGVDLGAVEY